METLLKLKMLFIFNHIAVMIGLWFASPYWLFLTLLGYFVIGRLGGEIGLHRYFSHRSFRTQQWKERAMLFAGIFICNGGPLWWAGTHRKHHAVSDTEQDPQAPQNRIRIWNMNKWSEKLVNVAVEKKYSQDLFRNKNIRFVHKHYFKILLSTYFLLAIIDWRIPVFLISASAIVEFHIVGLTNGSGHKGGNLGYRNFNTDDASTNLLWLNVVTLGAGLHNNHHNFPTSSNFAVKEGEFDLLSMFIDKFLKVK